MSAEPFSQDAMALPLAERVALAQSLGQSISGQSVEKLDKEIKWALEESERRDAELSSGNQTGRTHEEVMRAARKAIE